MYKIIITALLLLMAIPAMAVQTVTINWDASPSTDVTNYRIYISEEPGAYLIGTNFIIETDAAARSVVIDVAPNVGNTVYAVVTAINSYGHESNPSNEVTRDLGTGEWIPPLPPTNLRVVDINTGI